MKHHAALHAKQPKHYVSHVRGTHAEPAARPVTSAMRLSAASGKGGVKHKR